MCDYELSLEYTLTYKEAYDTFSLLAFRHNRKKRNLTCFILTLLAVILLIVFALRKEQIYYLFLAFLSTLLLFYIIYTPVLKARKGAGAVSGSSRIYKLYIQGNGHIRFSKGNELYLTKDNNSRFIETGELFAIRANEHDTICIPKRILSSSQEKELRKILISTCNHQDASPQSTNY